MSRSILTFGEIMLRLTPAEKNERLLKSHELAMDFAGAEANVATALCCMGNEVEFVSKLPDNPLGEAAINRLSNFGVITNKIVRGGDRIGIYFIEQGYSIRSSRVTYDRDHSALQSIGPNEFNWEALLAGNSWLHLTGITPSLSTQCAEECLKAVNIAKNIGLQISFDLNFRRKMWKDVSDAKHIFEQIISECDLLIANEGALNDVFSIYSSQSSVASRAKEISATIALQFPNTAIAITCRHLISSHLNQWSALYYDGQRTFESVQYDLQIIDRFGTGDAFAAGLIHGILHEYNSQKIIEFATAAAALKHTVPGDLSTFNVDDIMNILAGNTKGHIER